jgi:hypothetical protein
MGEPVVVEERAGDDGNVRIGGGPEQGVVLWMNGTNILGERIGADARPIAPLEPAAWPGSPIGVERCGDRWLAAWIVEGAAFVAPIDDRGVRGEPVRVVPQGVYGAGFACDADRALVAWGTAETPRKLYATEIVGDTVMPPVLVSDGDGSHQWLSARRYGSGWQIAWSDSARAHVAQVDGTSAEARELGAGWRPVFAGDEVLFADRKGPDVAYGPDGKQTRTVPNTFAATSVGDRWFGIGNAPDHQVEAGPLLGPRTPLGKLSQYPEGATIGDRAVFAWSNVGVVHGVSLDAAGVPAPATVLSVRWGDDTPIQRNPQLAVGPGGYLLAWEQQGIGCEGVSARRIGPGGELGAELTLAPCTEDAQLQGLEVSGSPTAWLVAWTDKRDHDYATDRRDLRYAVVGAEAAGAARSAGAVRGTRLAAAWDGQAWQLQSGSPQGVQSRRIGADGVAAAPVARATVTDAMHDIVCDAEGCATIAVRDAVVTFAPWNGAPAREAAVLWPEEATRRQDGGVVHSRYGAPTQLIALSRDEAHVVYAHGDIGWADRCSPAGCVRVAAPGRVRAAYDTEGSALWWTERSASGVASITDLSGPIVPGLARVVACDELCFAATLAYDETGVPRITVARWP